MSVDRVNKISRFVKQNVSIRVKNYRFNLRLFVEFVSLSCTGKLFQSSTWMFTCHRPGATSKVKGKVGRAPPERRRGAHLPVKAVEPVGG